MPGINSDLLKCPFSSAFVTLRTGPVSPFAPEHGSVELRPVMGIKDLWTKLRCAKALSAVQCHQPP